MKYYNEKYINKNNKNLVAFKKFINHDYYSDKKLIISEFDNATILPLKVINDLWGNNLGGVVDENKKFIKESICVSSIIENDTEIVRINDGYDFSDYDYIDEPVIYMGLFYKQWGHMCLEWIARLWPFAIDNEKYKNYKIAYMSNKFEIEGNYLKLLNLLGIKKEQLILIKRPTKFKKVIIPEQSTNIVKYYTKEYKIMIDYICKKAEELKPKNFKTYDKIYFSRRFIPNIKIREMNIELLDKFMAKNGFKIIYPEKISLIDQINYLQNCKIFSSTSGSVAHNSLFLKDNTDCIFFNKYYIYLGFQFLIDKMKKLNVTYIDAHYSVLPPNMSYGPACIALNDNLKQFAADNNYKLVNSDNYKAFHKYIDAYFSNPENIKYLTPDNLELFKDGFETFVNENRFINFRRFSKTIEKLFSVKNEFINYEKYKKITILNHTFMIKVNK